MFLSLLFEQMQLQPIGCWSCIACCQHICGDNHEDVVVTVCGTCTTASLKRWPRIRFTSYNVFSSERSTCARKPHVIPTLHLYIQIVQTVCLLSKMFTCQVVVVIGKDVVTTRILPQHDNKLQGLSTHQCWAGVRNRL